MYKGNVLLIKNACRMLNIYNLPIYIDTFLQIKHKEMQSIMGRALNRYVRATVVQRTVGTDEYDGAGDYERQYSCYPPVVCMILISLIEVM
jgi:hypothetical protein